MVSARRPYESPSCTDRIHVSEPAQAAKAMRANFKLRIRWSSGVKLADGSRDRLRKITLVLPLWTDGVNIQGCVFDAACQAKEGLYGYDYTWHVGSRDGKLPAFVNPPQYNKQLARRIGPERSTLLGLVSEIAISTGIAFKTCVRERLEEHAIDV